MPWYVFASIILLPVVVFLFLDTSRERRKEFVRRFFRVHVWLILAGYAFFWARERFEW